MIKEIIKGVDGYIIETDSNSCFIDYRDMSEIIGYHAESDVVIGYNRENQIEQLNVTTHARQVFSKIENKRFELLLCGRRCWYECSHKEEEIEYAKIFDYLKECPKFDYIPELQSYLISELLRKSDIEAVSFHLSELLGCEPDDDVDSYEPCFGYVFELVRSILELSEEN